MSFKCLIVDDEPIAQDIVKGFVMDTPNLVVHGVCDNAMQALEILQKSSIDILFLDIEMPKISGLSFLKTLQNPPPTILTTAYREFALEGFDLNVVDYLLKPFSFERFLKAVNKVEQFTEPTYEYFRVDGKNVKVYYDDIEYIEGLSNYVRIHLSNSQIVVYDKLVDLDKKLPANQFIRVHRSYIISMSKLKAYGNDYVEVSDKRFSVGNTYRDRFFEMIKRKIY